MELQVLKPGTVTIPSDVKTMAFVDRNLIYGVDSTYQNYKYLGEVVKDSLSYDSLVKKSSYDGFAQNIPEFFQLDTIPFIQLEPSYLSDTIRTYPQLAWATVDSICALNNSDILVVLEGAKINTEYEVNSAEGFWGTVDINYWAIWRIYDPLYQKVCDQYIAVDSLFVEEFSNSYKKLVNGKIPSRQKIMQDVGYSLGEDYIQRISPVWKSVQRKYYCSGGKRMDAACYFLNQMNWEAAMDIWKSIATNSTKEYKKAGKAAYNLALAYEVQGDLKQANQWIRKSIFFFKQKETLVNELEDSNIYALELLERKNDQDKLKLFFGE
jgi:hypothetical protein